MNRWRILRTATDVDGFEIVLVEYENGDLCWEDA